MQIEQELCRIVVSGFFFGFVPLLLIFCKILEAIQDNNNYKKRLAFETYKVACILNDIDTNLRSIKYNVRRECNSLFNDKLDENVGQLISEIEYNHLRKNIKEHEQN